MTTARIRLIEAGPQRPITVILAPAGFGKSTLVDTWIQRADVPNAMVRFEDDTVGTVRAADLSLALVTCVESLGAPPDAVGQLRGFLSEHKDSLGEEFPRDGSGDQPVAATDLPEEARKLGANRLLVPSLNINAPLGSGSIVAGDGGRTLQIPAIRPS